ncbi:MAG: hypothetical protein EP298_01015 [Gammaproteobacteria bacterium]|nr:MAG: hypothetical protein EP298_01015 [Gammaproteobacteria bacterium]UTW41933.1 hypothetical protein KFE69_10525 [bacterium SCSIO 12844]
MKKLICRLTFLAILGLLLSACSSDDNSSVSNKFKSASDDVVSASKKAASATSQAAGNTWDATKDTAKEINK